MTKRALALSLLIFTMLAVGVLALTVGHCHPVRAPELFGDACRHRITGTFSVVTSGPVGFWMKGAEDGTLIQAWGPKVEGAEQPISYHTLYRGGRFRGWIDFRGHPRPFCGADSAGNFPLTCKLQDGAI